MLYFQLGKYFNVKTIANGINKFKILPRKCFKILKGNANV